VGPGGGRPAKSPSRPVNFYVGLFHDFVHTCLHEKGEGQGGGESRWRPNHMADLAPLGELLT
jgi:hypothetical protein